MIVSAILSKLWFSGFCEVGLYKDQLRDESLYSINIKISHILLFLKSLSLKDHIPIDIFLNEIAFYRPNAEAIRDFLSAEVFQIWSKSQIISYFITSIDDRTKEMTVNFKGLLLQDDIDNDKKCIRTRIWNLFEYPESSRSAQVHYHCMLPCWELDYTKNPVLAIMNFCFF